MERDRGMQRDSAEPPARRGAGRRRTSVSAEVFNSMAQQAAALDGDAHAETRVRTRDMAPEMRSRVLAEEPDLSGLSAPAADLAARLLQKQPRPKRKGRNASLRKPLSLQRRDAGG